MFNTISRMVFTLILATFITKSEAEPVEIDYTLKMTIHPQSGLLTLVNGSELLQCALPGIEHIGCGFNSTINQSGQCVVPASEAFGIDYEVTDVNSCWGTNGTPEWRTTLQPFSGGSGTYTKTINNGITETTTFTLNCNVDSAFTYEGKAVMSQYTKIPWVYEGHFRGIINWIGDQLFFNEYTSELEGTKIFTNGNQIKDGYDPYLFITDLEPEIAGTTLVSGKELVGKGRCSTLGESGVAQLNISSSDKFANTCHLPPGKEYYLVMVLFERKSKTPMALTSHISQD